MSNPALYYIKWLVYSASDGFGNGWKKSFINLAYRATEPQNTLPVQGNIRHSNYKTEPDISGIKDNSDSSFGLWPYDIPGEDWIYKCGNDWCVDTTLTINCSMFNNTQE